MLDSDIGQGKTFVHAAPPASRAACLVLVTPETVMRWHRRGWRAYRQRKSKCRKPGRKRIPLALRQLIRRLAAEKPLWGQMWIMAELLKLGWVVSPRTVRKYMRQSWTGPSSPRWKDFLNLHATDIWACDFLTVRMLTFQTLYMFFLIHHATREVVHVRGHGIRAQCGPVNRWSMPASSGSHRSICSATGTASYGNDCSRKVKSLGVRERRTPVRAPKANAIAERFVGTLRWECLDHVFIFNEQHLQMIVDEFVVYYNRQRPHRSLDHRPPCPASISTGPPEASVIAAPVLGGLHHVYRRAA